MVSKKHFYLAIKALVIFVQAGELLKVVEHVSPVNIAGALMLLVIIITTRSGTEVNLD